LERVPTYKSKIEELKEKDIGTYGFLGYPVLQAADILIYKAEYVPVGQDQLPHLELTREIARRFNYFYKEIFPIPKEVLTEVPVLPGLDGRKMSKSYGNTIALSDSKDIVAKKVNSMVTDPAKVKLGDPGHPEICVVFAYHKIYSKDRLSEIENGCKRGSLGCVQDKKDLTERLLGELEPISERRKKLLTDPKIVETTLREGAEKAKAIAQKTLREVKEAMGLR